MRNRRDTHGQFHASARPRLCRNAKQVSPNRRFADPHRGGDLLVAHAPQSQFDRLGLLRRQIHRLHDGPPMAVIKRQRREAFEMIGSDFCRASHGSGPEIKEGVDRPLQQPQPRGEQNSTADAPYAPGEALLLAQEPLAAQGWLFVGELSTGKPARASSSVRRQRRIDVDHTIIDDSIRARKLSAMGMFRREIGGHVCYLRPRFRRETGPRFRCVLKRSIGWRLFLPQRLFVVAISAAACGLVVWRPFVRRRLVHVCRPCTAMKEVVEDVGVKLSHGMDSETGRLRWPRSIAN